MFNCTTEEVGQGSCLERLWNWFDDIGNGVEEGLWDISVKSELFCSLVPKWPPPSPL